MDKFEGDVQQVWDVSNLGLFQTCPYKYKQQTLDCWVWPSTREALSLAWGKAYHRGTEILDGEIFGGMGLEDALVLAFQAVEPWREILTREGIEEERDGKYRNWDTLLRAIVWYGETYKREPFKTAALDDGRPALEIRGEVPFVGDKRLSFVVDRIVEREGRLFVLDRKGTTQTVGPRYFESFDLGAQKNGYIYAMRALGIPVEGFIIDACQLLVGGCRFFRQTLYSTDAQIQEWLDECAYWVDQADRMAGEDFWPRNFQGCSQYGGCMYRRSCARSPEFRDATLAEYLVRGERRTYKIEEAIEGSEEVAT